MKPVSVYIIAGFVPIILLVAHMTIFATIWKKQPVDKDNCRCSCWDSIFKADHEDGLVVTYKHVYFNSNVNTLKMWAATVFFVIFMYEVFKHFLSLLLLNKLRWTMAVLFLGSLHTQYYSWWAYWNFWNDDYYPMWYHQIFFTLTDGISYLLVVLALDCTVEIRPWRILTMACIAVFHVISAGLDQFIENVVFGEGDLKMVLRDLLFMGTDVLYTIISIYELRQYAYNTEGVRLCQFLRRCDNLNFMLILFCIMFSYVLVFPKDYYNEMFI